MLLIVLLEKVNMIYWKYGNLSMILNNICEIYYHNIVKQDECIFIGKYIIWEVRKTVQL